jgi:hypothetical protein
MSSVGLTNNDESYLFTTSQRRGEVTIQKSIVELLTGLEEVESMFVGQFKRAQSELTRGNA